MSHCTYTVKGGAVLLHYTAYWLLRTLQQGQAQGQAHLTVSAIRELRQYGYTGLRTYKDRTAGRCHCCQSVVCTAELGTSWESMLRDPISMGRAQGAECACD